MDAFIGTWKGAPELTEGFDEFAEKNQIPAEMREEAKKSEFVVEVSRAGDEWTIVTRQTGKPPQEIKFTLDQPFDMPLHKGEKVKAVISWDGSQFVEKATIEGQELTNYRRVEGGLLVAEYNSKGAKLITKLRKA